jgi:uncharacterized membrane protein
MNDAHLHMVVNHFPIIGTILGLGILIASIILKNKTVQNVGYCLFIIAAIFGAVSMSTGEGAEEIAEKLPEVTHQIIHEHEEMAEKLIIFLYILGVTSIVGLYFNLKKHSKASIFSYLVAIISLATVYLAKETGTTGGEIRHTEIRNDSGIQQATSENLNEDKD